MSNFFIANLKQKNDGILFIKKIDGISTKAVYSISETFGRRLVSQWVLSPVAKWNPIAGGRAYIVFYIYCFTVTPFIIVFKSTMKGIT